MYVLVLLAVVMTGQPDEPIAPVTRSEVGYYQSREACEAAVKPEGMKFLAALKGIEVGLYASKCVMVTGPEGTPA